MAGPRYKRVKESERLIQLALLQLWRTVPFHEITITALCKEATVSRNTFYRIYQTKEDVLKTILSDKTTEASLLYSNVIDNSQETPDSKKLYLIYFKYFSYWYEQSELLSLLSRDELFYWLGRISRTAFPNQGTERVMNTLNLDASLHEYYLCWQSSGLIYILGLWQEHQFRESPEQMAELMVRIHEVISR